MATKKGSTDAQPRFIYELARELGVRSSELRNIIGGWGLGWDVSSHMKKLTPEQITEMHTRLAGDAPAEKPAAKRGARSKSSRKPKAAAVEVVEEVKEEAPKKPRRTRPSKAKKAAAADEQPVAEEKPKRGRSKKADTPAKAEKKPAKAEKKPAKGKKPAPAKKGEKPAKDEKPKRSKKTAKSEEGSKGADQSEATDTPKDEKSKRKSRRPERKEDVAVEDVDKKVKAWLMKVLKGMGYARPRIDVVEQKDVVEVNVTGAGITALLGRTDAAASTKLIEALQLMATKAVFPHGTRSKNVIIDVAGFRSGRIEALAAAAERAGAYVRASGKPLRFAGMNAFDRRAFHTTLRKASGLWSESEGYGVFRQLRVKVAKPQNNPRREQKKAEPQKTEEAPKNADAQDE